MAVKQRAARRPEPEVIDLEQEALSTIPELANALADGRAVQAFLARAIEGFRQGIVLRQRSEATLEDARQLRPPQTKEEDLSIQVFAKRTATEKKEIEEHWSITRIVHALQKRLVAERTKGTTPLDEANALVNGLHNRYVQDENRRVAAEADRLRREAEARAQAERDRELRLLEEAALKAEAESPTLSPRETKFVDAYTSEVTGWKGNAERAAQVAGYKDAAATGARLLTMPKVTAAIRAREDAARVRKQAAAVKEQPLEVETHEVKRELLGTEGRSTWSAELLDETALIDAVFSGKYGIPRDVLCVNTVKLNEYARSLHERLDLWPGCRAKKTTKV